MRIIEDSRQKVGKHDLKRTYFERHGIEVVRRKLDFGDYALDVPNPKVSIDTKQDVEEIAGNIHGRREHERFKRELARAEDAGCRLVCLIENLHGIETVRMVDAWENRVCVCCIFRRSCDPRGKGLCRVRKGGKKPIQGPQLSKAMETMEGRYNVEWDFCSPVMAGERIVQIIRRWEYGLDSTGEDNV